MVDVKGHGRPDTRVGAFGSVIGLCALFWVIGFGAVGLMAGQWDLAWWTEPESPATVVPLHAGIDSNPLPVASSSGPSASCNLQYDGCLPLASDVDCAGSGDDGPLFVRGPVRVVGQDVYGLDADGDGIGCK